MESRAVNSKDIEEVGTEVQEATDEVNLNGSSTEEEDERRKQELRDEMVQLEDEIKTLRQALERKERHLQQIKQELGITKWAEFKQGVGQKYQTVQTTQTYNKLAQASASTKQAIGAAGEKTSTALKNFGSATSKKWQEIRESPKFQSVEEKMWATTGAIKAKVWGQKPQDAVGEASAKEPPKPTTEAPSAI